MSERDETSEQVVEQANDGLTDEERHVWSLEGFDHLPAFLSVPDAAKVLGVSRSTGYACVADGTLRAINIRRRIVVPRHELFKMLFQFRLPPIST